MPDFHIRVIVDPAKGVTGVKRVQSELQQTERVARNVGRRIAAALAAAFAGFTGVAALKSFSRIEQGLLGVGKTADLTAKDLALLRGEITGISRDLPFARTELLSIAQAAGQLGVKGVANLALFAETIAKLGVASDIAGAEAATALVRILNVTGEGVGAVDTLASVIVELGNNFATGEAQILRMGNEVARATALFGVSSTEAVALGTALASLGVRAELGGSSVGRAFFAINAAIDEGGDALQNLSSLTDIAIDDLRQAFDEDATGIFERFLVGLGRLGSASEITKALEAFGLKGQEVLKVLPVLAKNAGDVADTIAAASAEAAKNAALNEEVARVMDASATAADLFGNAILELVESVGEALTPAFIDAADSVREFIIEAQEGETLPAIYDAIGIAAQGAVDGVKFLADNMEILAGIFALLIARQIGLAASSQAVVGALAAARGAAVAATISFQLAGAATTAASIGMTLAGTAAAGARAAVVLLAAAFGGPVGLAIAVGIGVAALALWVTNSQSAAEAADVVRASISNLTDEFGDQEAGIDSLTEKYRKLSETKLQNALIDLQIEFTGIKDATKTLDSELKSTISRLAGARRALGAIGPASGSVTEAVIIFEQLRIKGEDTEGAVREVIQRLIDMGDPEAARGLNEIFQALIDAETAAAGLANKLSSVQLAIAGLDAGPELSAGRRDRALAEAGGETEAAETTPLKPDSGDGTTFADIVKDLQREITLVGLSNAKREQRIEIFRAEEAIERKLNDTEKAHIRALVFERQELEDNEAIFQRLLDLETEGDLLRLTNRERAVAVEILRLEESLYGDLTAAEEAEIGVLVEQNRLLGIQSRLREELTGGFLDIEETRAVLPGLFDDATLSANGLRNALLDLRLEELELRIAFGDGSFIDGFTAGMIRMTEEAQNFAANTGELFAEFIGEFVKGTSDAFAGAILGTEKFGTALKSVARNAIGALISALIQMGIQYVITQAIGTAVGTAAATASAGEAALVAAAWAPAAAAVSLASYGANAAPAGIGIAVVFALVAALAAAAGAFLFLREGGEVKGPGTGTSDSVLARVSRGEFVVNARQTDKFRPLLERINAGESISDIVVGDVGAQVGGRRRGGQSITDIVVGAIGNEISNVRVPQFLHGGIVQGPQGAGGSRTFDILRGSRAGQLRTDEILDREPIPEFGQFARTQGGAGDTFVISPTFVFESGEAVEAFGETESQTMSRLGTVVDEAARRRGVRRTRF